MKTTTDNRARLLNIAAGGDGHTTPYAEQDAQGGYIVHLPARRYASGKTSPAIDIHLTTEEAARGLLLAIETGAKPRPPER